MKKEKIGVGFHMVANTIYESYDRGEEPKEMAVGEKYNVDEMMQDIEILRYE